MTTPKIYIGSTDVIPDIGQENGPDHTYLIYDPDLDGDGDASTGTGVEIIRGGPEMLITGRIQIEVGRNQADSEDAFRSDSPADRNLTTLVSAGTETLAVWNSFKIFAQSMTGTFDSNTHIGFSDVTYSLPGPNSNSVINSVLNAHGINMAAVLPMVGGDGGTIRQDAQEFPGAQAILDGSGDDTFTLFSGQTYNIRDNAGSDTFIIQDGANAIINTDGDDATANTILLQGINPDDVVLTRVGNALVIDGGDTQVTVLGHFLHDDTAAGTLAVEYNGLTILKDLADLQSADLSILLGVNLFNLPGDYRAILADFQQVFQTSDPLVVDLDDNGYTPPLETAGIYGAYFDMDNDGFAEAMTWVRPQDGLLVLDRDGNGTIDNGTELFGSRTVNGFTALRELDFNHDGVIDPFDPQWHNLQVWQDKNSDGFSQTDELYSMAEIGFTSIALPPANGQQASSAVATDTGDGSIGIFNRDLPVPRREARQRVRHTHIMCPANDNSRLGEGFQPRRRMAAA
ncbi:MAG: hypothetical protein HY370_06280 [Proteobacteria bacterium]|nr:hypothetical protein [Pseudomonadota bacterium]